MNFLTNLLQFIKNMIYFNKLIDIWINRQENQKVVNNYFVGTRVEISKANLFLYGLKKGLEKEVAEFRAGQDPTETRAKIVPLDYFTDAAWRSPFIRTNNESVRTNK